MIKFISYLQKILLTILFLTGVYVLSGKAGEPCCHILICCRGNNAGTTFLVNGEWNPAHDYTDKKQVLDILQKIKDAGIQTVIIDMTNASQWMWLWNQYEPMVNNVRDACHQKQMKFIIFIGAAFTEKDKERLKMSQFSFWNGIARKVWEMWAHDPAYKKYGYGDDRPVLIVFQPSDMYWDRYKAAPDSEKTYLSRFHIGTTQVNSPILPGESDGWGYRNYSQSVNGKVRFACPNKGVPPTDWGRINREEWVRRVRWASQAEEYSIYGSYDDTCDAIHWGIADTRNCKVPYKKYPEDQPSVYYDVVKQILTDKTLK